MALKNIAVLIGALSVPGLADIERDAGGMEIKFRGSSGKFAIYSKLYGEGDPNRLVFEVDEFRELDSSGAEVSPSKNSDPSHQFKNFRQTEFDFISDGNVTIGTATAAKVSFTSSMNGLGTFTVDTYLMSTEGEVGPDLADDNVPKFPVWPGDVKFNIDIAGWQWCTTASCNADGAFIDVSLQIMSKQKPQPKASKGEGKAKDKAKALDLGGGIPLDFSPDLMLDGSSAIMPDGFPKSEVRGAKNIITFRFPKGDSAGNSVVYDPVVGSSDSDSLAGSDSGSWRPAVGILGMLTPLAFFM